MTDKKDNTLILICDDDRTQLLMMGKTLLSQGYDIVQAANGELALEQFVKCEPNMVLLDVKMPGLNGFEVCTQIRQMEKGKDVPILMITGSDDHDSIEKAFSVGATDFLSKPIKWPMFKHRIKYMLRSFQNQESLKLSESELRFLAYYDPLTELPNRQFIIQLLSTFIIQSKRREASLAVMSIDLDNFKRINDTLGHKSGDLVLIEVGKRLVKALREGDAIGRSNDSTNRKVARLGSDEFILILNDCGDVYNIASVAKRLIRELSMPIKLNQFNVVVTPSIGISVFPNDGLDAETLIKSADSAMYEAKSSGKSCYKLFSSDLNQRSVNRLKLEEYMREALVTNQFELYYQPKLDSVTKKADHAEALIRLHHPTLGLISPAEFIPVAEDTGLIVDIGFWVLTQTCAQINIWRKTLDTPISVSINVSAKQINQPDFVDQLKAVIESTNTPTELLEIELTESIIMNNADENIAKLAQIKALGVGLSIDDFGTGYSSLSYLKLFPIDVLKIDRYFINDLSSENDRAIVAAIAAMAKAMKLNIVVEGVETASQLQSVVEICGPEPVLIQGFYYSKPLPVSYFEKFIQDIGN